MSCQYEGSNARFIYRSVADNRASKRKKEGKINFPVTFVPYCNAVVHTAHEVAAFFHTHHLQALAWPAHLPDLNIIEQIWHYLKGRVTQLPIASSKENVQRVLNC
ncbi:hypothetical protein EON65_59315 [archaeon]|nr:MAG: hypothetical protein EON65_59315 [archaeon]